ncbi:S66 family peptidase [Streptomyces drozdowiczii]|uniref:LD-carboxypeptidase n=1 Tax=Streptomyces drozdowiczii TaxID=202862 RepID=A0ABY6PM21_9ACTN|nr:S66 peptidase family protein [Streptomyces drozdowiczii]MCX0247353.1 LD-carboxypeptidase [Streptomyces drozdowiczii]UZK53242.1 LD-carboxypeptidase [Streptomyces drozdowiczii]
MTPSRYPAKPRPGDRVAVLSPSSGLPGLLPLPHELGLRRIREDFGLEPVEYPCTRKMGSTPQERAADLHAAFADPEIKAVIASIGGDDQITVLPHLDRELLRANPKPFFGYSDNTNLLVFLDNLGIVGYHGGSVMVELGRPGALHPQTAESLRAALFTHGAYELTPAKESGSTNRDWRDPRTFEQEPDLLPADDWSWHHADRVVEGASWGGNLEILAWMLMADREIQPPEAYEGRVLFLETSEELPGADEVYRILRNMGERGLLRRFPALLMGRAKNWSFDKPLDAEAGALYRREQREAVLRALAEYAPDTMAVFDVDCGHTDPQVVIPYGGVIRVDGVARRIVVTY